MNAKSNNQIRKFLYGIALAGMVLSLCFGMSGSPVVRAQDAGTESPTETVGPSKSSGTPMPWPPSFPQPYSITPNELKVGGKILPQASTEIGAQALTVGASGLSFRYVQTFGVTETPYISDTTHLYQPGGLFMDASDNLLVTESQGYRLLRYNSSGVNTLVIGKAGVSYTDDYVFSSPADAALDGGENIWVVDNTRVVQYTSSGVISQSLPAQNDNPWNAGNSNGRFDNARGIAFDSDGRMYVSDANNNRVQVYDMSTGSPVYSITIGTGIAGSGSDQFNSPYRIAVYGNNHLYVVDTGNNRIQHCIYSGATWSCITLDSGLNNPLGIAVDSSNNVYISDTNNGRIRKCTSGGVCSDFVIDTYWLNDLAIDSSGNIYGSSTWQDIVVKYDSGGNFVGTYVGVEYVPYLTDNYHYNHPRVALDSSNNIIIVEEYGHRLIKLNASGVAQWSIGVPGVDSYDNTHLNWPHGVAVDTAGNIYVADNCRVQIISPDGNYLNTLGTGCGTGNYEFGWATGVDVDKNGNIYVVDLPNHRVQIYNSSRVFIGRIGATGDCSTANDRLCNPIAVDVDTSGNIYVTDGGNLRVQKFNSSRVWQMTIGDGTWGGSFNQLAWPEDVVVDAQGRIFVTDWSNNRVQVFDPSGAYLTTIGGSWGSNTSQLTGAPGVDVDSSGNVYVADWGNARIQKFAPGTPGWVQSNINGFGDLANYGIWSLSTFNGQMYAGTGNGNGAQIWRSADGQNWSQFTPPWSATTDAVPDMESFGSYLYTGTSNSAGGEIWRTDGLTWSQVVNGGFGDTNNYGIDSFAIFSNAIYAATSNNNGTLQIYRSTSGDSSSWTPVVSDGFGSDGVAQDVKMDVYGSYLYIGLGRNGVGEFWRTNNGTTWSPIFTDGLAVNNTNVSAMANFGGTQYIGLRNVTTGGEVWSSTDGINFSPIFSGGLGNSDNGRPYGLFVFNGRLHLIFSNIATGAEVWRTANGTTWEQVSSTGWGDSNNAYAGYLDKVATVFINRLFIGTFNEANGGEIWQMLMLYQIFLPIVIR
jgi:streptogramin lyase